MRRLLCLLLAVLSVTLIIHADAAPAPQVTRVPIGAGRVLTISAPKQLTYGAHVGDFLVQPGSRNAAYAGMRYDGNTMTPFVSLVELKYGKTTTLLEGNGTSRRNDVPRQYELSGWTGDGRYLLVWHTEMKAALDTVSEHTVLVYESMDTGVVPCKVRRIALPDGSGEYRARVGDFERSPSGKLFAMEWTGVELPAKSTTRAAFLYDPARNTVRCLPLPNDALFLGWADNAHLLLLTPSNHGPVSLSHDIVTGKDTPATNTLALPPNVPRANPNMRLSLATVPSDLSSLGVTGHVAAFTLLLNINTSDAHLPAVRLRAGLGAHGAQAILAPDESAALWVEHSDLFVCMFGEDAASVRER